MMKPSSAFTQANFTHMGSSARACLTLGRSGKVLAAFSKAIYLLTDDAELFWIASNDSPMHRRALKISVSLSGPQVDSPFQIQDQRLIIDPSFVYTMNSASIWNTRSIDQNNIIDINDIPARIQTLFSSLDLSKVKGFGNFIPDILRLAQNESIYPKFISADPKLVLAQPFVLEIARACLENQPARISQIADALVGLGAGLTPSGDYFLGGLLFAMKTLQAAYPDSNFINHAIPVEIYRSRTHLISFTLLKDLASGHAIAPLHQIINGLLSKESLESIYPSVLQLTQVGHTTGWDMLTGLLAGLLIAFRSNYLISSFRTSQSIEA